MLLVKKIAPAPLPTPGKKKTKAEKISLGSPASSESRPWVKMIKDWGTERKFKVEVCENGFRVDLSSDVEDFRLCVIRMPNGRFSIGLYFDSMSPDYTKSFESCQIPLENMIQFVEWLFSGRENFKFEGEA